MDPQPADRYEELRGDAQRRVNAAYKWLELMRIQIERELATVVKVPPYIRPADNPTRANPVFTEEESAFWSMFGD